MKGPLPMPRMNPLFIALMSLAIAAVIPASAETVYHGTAGIQAGSLEHPLGLADETASLLRSVALDMTATTGDDSTFWRWSYSGSVDLYDETVPLDFMRHALGLERILSTGRGHPATAFGVRWTARSQMVDGALYDHVELDGYLTKKAYPAPDTMLRTVLGARLRRYADLPEESFIDLTAWWRSKILRKPHHRRRDGTPGR